MKLSQNHINQMENRKAACLVIRETVKLWESASILSEAAGVNGLLLHNHIQFAIDAYEREPIYLEIARLILKMLNMTDTKQDWELAHDLLNMTGILQTLESKSLDELEYGG
jgi:hypothetical protein